MADFDIGFDLNKMFEQATDLGLINVLSSFGPEEDNQVIKKNIKCVL